jgi:hypothetical protein
MNGAITAWQLWAAVAMPTLVTLLGILLNRRDVDRLDRGLESLEARLGKRIDSLDKRMDAVEIRMNQQTQLFHQDVISLLKMHQEHETRITRLELR